MKEFIIIVCTDSTEIFFSKLRSATCQVFSLTLTVQGVSNKHCLLTFFIEFIKQVQEKSLMQGLPSILSFFVSILINSTIHEHKCYILFIMTLKLV